MSGVDGRQQMRIGFRQEGRLAPVSVRGAVEAGAGRTPGGAVSPAKTKGFSR